MELRERLKRAHDVLDGCILSLTISESAKAALKTELEALYESAAYPMIGRPQAGYAPTATAKATSRTQTTPVDVSDAGDTT